MSEQSRQPAPPEWPPYKTAFEWKSLKETPDDVFAAMKATLGWSDAQRLSEDEYDHGLSETKQAKQGERHNDTAPRRPAPPDEPETHYLQRPSAPKPKARP